MPSMNAVPTRRQACQYLAGAVLGGVASLAQAVGSARVEATAGGARWQAWPAGRATPRLELPEVDAAPWSLAQQAGRPVLLNFWASWCEPCRAELPSLVALAQSFSGRGLLVVAVNFRESADSVRRVREAQGAGLRWLRDSYGEAAVQWGVRSFPTSVLVNPQGRAALTVHGVVDWADSAVQQRLAGYL